MPKVSKAHLEARRQEILEAASACFARKGFHQTTMHDICQLAELSPGAVYRYFSGKEEIIEAMGEEGRRRSRALIEAAGERGSTIEVLEGLVDAFFTGLDDPQNCALDIEIWAEARRNERVRETMNRSNTTIRELFEDIIRRAQERGEINSGLPAEGVARAMMSFYVGLLLQKTLDPSVDVAGYVAAMRAMLGGSIWTSPQAQSGKEDA